MRTGIYVYENTTLTIEATEPVVLTSLDNRTISFGNTSAEPKQTMKVDRGIYRALTESKISVTSEDIVDIDMVIVADDKDPFPDASAKATQAFNVQPSTLTSFFKIMGLKSAAF
ncbi:MAG TPA: hypothetical protein VFK02_23775 [Kofleriaceae bacterium]|nr:hypothetical protein [Kofleriaceae bacterium]